MMFVSLGLGAAVAIALIVVVSVLTGGNVSSTTTAPPALVGTTLPSLTEGGLHGTTVSAPWNHHQATAVIFFASWCEPCKTELPALAHYLATHSLGKVAVLGVDTQDQLSAGQAVVARDHLTFPVFFDPASTVAAGKFQLGALPDTAFVTATGKVQDLHIGPISATQFAAAVAALNA